MDDAAYIMICQNHLLKTTPFLAWIFFFYINENLFEQSQLKKMLALNPKKFQKTDFWLEIRPNMQIYSE